MEICARAPPTDRFGGFVLANKAKTQPKWAWFIVWRWTAVTLTYSFRLRSTNRRPWKQQSCSCYQDREGKIHSTDCKASTAAQSACTVASQQSTASSPLQPSPKPAYTSPREHFWITEPITALLDKTPLVSFPALQLSLLLPLFSMGAKPHLVCGLDGRALVCSGSESPIN